MRIESGRMKIEEGRRKKKEERWKSCHEVTEGIDCVAISGVLVVSGGE